MADLRLLNHLGGRDLPAASGEALDRACHAAADAFESWSHTTPALRQGALLRIAAAVEEFADEFVEAEVGGTGKPPELFLAEELPAIVDSFRFFAGAARTLPGAAAGEYADGCTSMLRREPVGVCAQIVPWNYRCLLVSKREHALHQAAAPCETTVPV